MYKSLSYRGMSVNDGVKHIESHYTASELEGVLGFADLHELCDANMTLPFPEDVGTDQWLAFSNTVIKRFDAARSLSN